MWKSVVTIEDDDVEETNMWLCYWTIFGLTQALELFFGFVFNFIPYYGIIRLVFFIYLMAPQTQGARTIYKAFLRDLISQHKEELQKFFDSAQNAGDAMVNKAAEEAGKKVQNIDLNSVADASSKIRDMTGKDEKKDD